MLNSFTNFMHASALGIYTYLVYTSYQAGEQYYTLTIFFAFLLLFVLKILGIIVHLPPVEHNKPRHDFFWTIIAIGLCALNYFTLKAINLHTYIVILGMVITLGFVIAFLYSMFTGPGYFFYIAAASVLVYLLCVVFTTGPLRLAWIMIVISSVAWIVLAKVPYLLRTKLHNDIYHLALIVSTYYLYSTIETGLWVDNTGLSIRF